ncbi:hypothetical protein [Jeotgalicoccus psychrophilus]|uniref:hypothetical protein n=1 Tax=Jeotgalicoccus psychrophilus TaxID=157228 RepID=UPI00047DA46D|nr:hypothetical protein [Jeotgalicoccus psychrophilus]
MNNELISSKKHGVISYSSLIIGVICFFIVFVTPTRIANAGNLIGDYITFVFTGVGIILSIIGLVKKTERNIIPIISLILSSSLFLFWFIVIFLLVTGQMDFAP